MYPISPDLTYEVQEKEKYINPQHPVYVVSGAAGTETSPPSIINNNNINSINNNQRLFILMLER